MSFIETIDPDDADGALAEIYRRVANPDGSVDAVMRAHSLSPGALKAHFELYVTALHRDSPLSRADRELVGVVVSRLNGCRYCLEHHRRGLERLIDDERRHVVDALATGRVTRLDEREQALATYATKLTTNPHDVRPDDVQRLRDAGLDDRAIHDLVQTIAYFAYANRIVNGLGVALEGGDFAVGQWPEAGDPSSA